MKRSRPAWHPVSVLRRLALIAAATSLGSLGLLVGLASGQRSPDVARSARSAASYIISKQADNGAFFSSTAAANSTAEALVALASAGATGPPIERSLAHLAASGPSDAENEAAYAGRIAMGLSAYGKDPRRFSGFDYARSIERFFDARTGSYDARKRLYAHSLAVLGLVSAEREVPREAIDFLRRNECAGGGFGHESGCIGGPDTDTTVMASNALLAAGVERSDPALDRSFLYLRVAQNVDGGFGYTAGTPTNANSTGLVLSLLAKVDEDPTQWRRGDGPDPLTALVALQNPDGGFRYRADRPRSNDYATVQAIPGLMAVAYPPARLADLGAGAVQDRAPKTLPVASPSRKGGASQTPVGNAVPDATPAGSLATHIQVVVTYPDGRTETYCPRLDGAVTGIEALRSTGVDVVTRGFGSALGEAVCAIGGRGDPKESCPGSRGHWHYWHLVEGQWAESSLGASQHMVRPGEVEGWTWATGASAQPPPRDFPSCTTTTAAIASVTPRTSGAKDPVRLAALALAGAWMGLAATRAARARAK